MMKMPKKNKVIQHKELMPVLLKHKVHLKLMKLKLQDVKRGKRKVVVELDLNVQNLKLKMLKHKNNMIGSVNSALLKKHVAYKIS